MWKIYKKNKIIYFKKTFVNMIEINSHILELKNVHYADRHFHIDQEDMNIRLGDYIDNYSQLIEKVRNQHVYMEIENVFFIPAIHSCFSHALIDHIFSYFWAINDIRKYNPNFKNFTIFIVERNIGLYYLKNDKVIEGLGQPDPKYKGVYKDLLSLLSPDQHIFEVGIYNEDHYIFKNCYFYKREDEFQRSPWNCLEYYPQFNVRNHRNLSNLLFSDRVILQQLRKFRTTVLSKHPNQIQNKKIEGKRCVIINRRGKVRSLDEKMGDLTDLLIKYQESSSETFTFGGVLYLEDLTFWEQVEVFVNNNMIISPHGSGLIHTIWANKLILVEVVFNKEDNPLYKRIADITENEIIQIPYGTLIEKLSNYLSKNNNTTQ